MTFVPSHPHLRLGRKPKTFKPMLGFGQLKTLVKGELVSPKTFDYTVGLPSDLGMMFNDSLGDCTAAAKYHRWQALQWLNTGKFWDGSVLADLALRFYELSTGYEPTDPSTDQGGNMQDLAHYLVTTGMLLPDLTTDKFVAAFSVDPTSVVDLAYCGWECVGIDFGITVTTKVMPADGSQPPRVWDAGGTTLGGHDVYGLARLPNGNWKVCSWGSWYEMTPAFVAAQVNEAFAYVSADGLRDGRTVLGLDLPAWQNILGGHAHQESA